MHTHSTIDQRHIIEGREGAPPQAGSDTTRVLATVTHTISGEQTTPLPPSNAKTDSVPSSVSPTTVGGTSPVPKETHESSRSQDITSQPYVPSTLSSTYSQPTVDSPSNTLAVGPETVVKTSFESLVTSVSTLTVEKTTLRTSTLSPTSMLQTPTSSASILSAPAATSSGTVAHGSHVLVAAISIPMAFAAVAAFLILFITIWRWTRPKSYQRHRERFGAWYQDTRERCYLHNFGWGIGATLANWRETREKNKAVRAKRKALAMTEASILTGDGLLGGPKPDNAFQRWRKQRERQLEEARGRRLKEERQGMDAIGDRERLKLRDEHLSEQIAKKEWERIRREGMMSPGMERVGQWRDGVEPHLKSPTSEGGTTLVRSATRASDESSWKGHWRTMGEEEPREDEDHKAAESSGTAKEQTGVESAERASKTKHL